MEGLTQAEINEYWETVEAIVASHSIQWMGQGPTVAEEPLEDLVEPSARTRDTHLATPSSGTRSRDK